MQFSPKCCQLIWSSNNCKPSQLQTKSAFWTTYSTSYQYVAMGRHLCSSTCWALCNPQSCTIPQYSSIWRLWGTHRMSKMDKSTPSRIIHRAAISLLLTQQWKLDTTAWMVVLSHVQVWYDEQYHDQQAFRVVQKHWSAQQQQISTAQPLNWYQMPCRQQHMCQASWRPHVLLAGST